MLTLTGARPASTRGVDPVEDPRDREVDPVHRAEDRVVERVEADRDPPQAGRRPAAPPAPAAPTRWSSGSGRASPPSGRRSAASIPMRSGRSRRTSGSPPVIRSFSTPSADERRRATPLDLLEGQDLVPRQERVVAPEDLLRHAVGAPEVAPVRDRDPQVAQRPPERVGQAPGRSVEARSGDPSPILPGRDRPPAVRTAPPVDRAGDPAAGTTGADRWYL